METVITERKCLTEKKHSLLLFFAVFLLYSVVSMSRNCFSAALAAIVKEGFLTKTQTGTINASFWFFYAIFQIPGGIAAGKCKSDKLIFYGVMGAALTNLVLYFSHNYYIITVSWSLNAIFQFAVWPSIFKILSNELREKDRYNALVNISIGVVAGQAFSYIVAAVVKRWETIFLISSSMLALSAVFLHTVYKTLEKKNAFVTEKKKTEVREKADKRYIFPLMVKSGVLVYLPIIIFHSFVNYGFKVYSPVIMVELFPDISVSISNILGGIVAVSTVFGIMLMRSIYPNVIKISTLAVALFLSVVLAACSFMIHTKTWWVLFALIVFSIIPLNGVTQIINIIIPRKFSKYSAEVLFAGIINSVVSIGALISNFGVGFLADRLEWVVIFRIFAVLLTVSIALLLIITPKWRKFTGE